MACLRLDCFKASSTLALVSKWGTPQVGEASETEEKTM